MLLHHQGLNRVFKFYHKACGRFPEVLSRSVDLAITSPPYYERDGYSEALIEGIGDGFKRCLKTNSLLFFNFGFVEEDMWRPFRAAEILKDYLQLVCTISWVKSIDGKGRFTPLPGNNKLNRLWEPIFLFSNGSNWSFNRIAAGVPFSDKSNLERYNHDVDLRCGGDVWFIPYPNRTGKFGLTKGHKHKFPPALVERCILLSGIKPGSLVMDPFLGGGTTAWVANQMEFSSVGYEKSWEWFQLIEDGCKNPPLLLDKLHCGVNNGIH